MAKRMTDVELDRFREHLAIITETGTESEVRAYVDEHFPRLPEKMQDDILAGLLLTSLKEEAHALQESKKRE